VAIGWQFLICCLRQVLKILEGWVAEWLKAPVLKAYTSVFLVPCPNPSSLVGRVFQPTLFIVTERLGFFRLQFRLQS